MADAKEMRDRLAAEPSEVWTRTILKPLYEFKLRHWFYPLIAAHQGWAVILHEGGVIPKEDAARIFGALSDLKTAGPAALGEFNPAFEYFYLHVERFLTERAGEEVIGNLNLGRTRPEPLSRMHTRGRLLDTADGIIAFRTTLQEMAARYRDTVMPFYTHLQHAQPTTFGHYLLAIADNLARDFGRLKAAYANVNENTLGCGALAGSALPIDRDRLSALLGFEKTRENTLDSVAGVDHMVDCAAMLANMMQTMSRLAMDIDVWASLEFDMVDFADEFSGTSSLMPQKKNPYVCEYVRARAGHVIGDLTAVLAVAHNTFFQDTEDICIEVLPPTWRAFDTADTALELMGAFLATVTPKPEVMLERAAKGFSTATALADLIHAQRRLSYRTAHRIVGRTVMAAVQAGKTALEVTSEMVDAAARDVTAEPLGLAPEDIRRALDPAHFVQTHKVKGAPASEVMAGMLAEREQTLKGDTAWVAGKRGGLDNAKKTLDDTIRQIIG
ncbi:MAG: argininosuccinate lyase [bacterium]|nr:argininosuccinate lyase [bacterium]